MPTYVYAPVLKPKEKRTCDMCENSFELVQRMSDNALAACPTCGGEVERVVQPINISGHNRYNKNRSNADLERAGFTQYKKKGKGYYEKQFGKGGPQTIRKGN